MQPCNESYEYNHIHAACLLHQFVCQMCMHHADLKVAVINPSVQNHVYAALRVAGFNFQMTAFGSQL